MISLEQHERVAIVRLNRGTTNPLNLDLLEQMGDALLRVRQDSRVHSLVLASSNQKFFSIGFDLPHLFGLSRKDFSAFFRRFNDVCLDLYTLPKPTVAALEGHATAGGCILAICCDYRFIAEGRKLMGLNEIKLGVPLPYLADHVLRSLVGFRNARDIVDTGELFPPEESLRMGMVDQVLPLEQVLPKSVEKARSLGSLPHEAFSLIKRNRVEIVETLVVPRLEEKDRLFIDCWYSDEARTRLREAMAKF